MAVAQMGGWIDKAKQKAQQATAGLGVGSTAAVGATTALGTLPASSHSLTVSYPASPGTVIVIATQVGDATYNPAAPVTQTIVIIPQSSFGTVELVSTRTLTKRGDCSYITNMLVINLGTATAQNVVLTNVSVGAASGFLCLKHSSFFSRALTQT